MTMEVGDALVRDRLGLNDQFRVFEQKTQKTRKAQMTRLVTKLV